MKNVTEAQFEEAVLRPSFMDPIVVTFHASWCAPCKLLKPLIERLAGELNFILIGVDGGEEKGLATFYGVRGVPSVLVFKDGRVFSQTSGGKTEAQLKDFLFKAQVTQNILPGF